MHIFKRTDVAGVYRHIASAQAGLGLRIWDLMKGKAPNQSLAQGQDFPWQLDGAELLGRCLRDQLGVDEERRADNYKLVADVQDVLGKPSRKRAHLFEICKVFGFQAMAGPR